MCRVLAQTAAVVRGRVTGITPVFDERPGEGPRQIVELSAVETLLGLEQPNTLRLRVFGGQLPDGDLIEASHVPRFQIGDEYVVFLFNRSWRFAPVPLDFYFRVREEDGHETARDRERARPHRSARRPAHPAELRRGRGRSRVRAMLNPISTQEMTRVASVTKYRTDLEAIAEDVPGRTLGRVHPVSRRAVGRHERGAGSSHRVLRLEGRFPCLHNSNRSWFSTRRSVPFLSAPR